MEKGGGRGPGISKLVARHDDDDDDIYKKVITTHISPWEIICALFDNIIYIL